MATIAAALLTPVARLHAQFPVTGRVTTSGGVSVPDAIVRLRNRNITARTDTAGRYSVVARTPNDTLVVSRIGFAAREVGIAGRSTVDVQIFEAARSLEEVVVIGYGEKRRATMTESVGTVNDRDIQQVPIASADQALQGRVSGAQVTSSSGIPGAAVAVRIRGVSTVGNTQPLFVVDGIPVGRGEDPVTNPLASLNPSDIESISVLKDASSAAVYGVQASNGVVLITTKRGSLGKPTFHYDGYMGQQHTPDLWEMNSSQQYVALLQQSFDAFNAQNNLQPTDASYLKLNPDLQGNSPLLTRNIDWVGDVLHQNAPISSHSLSVSGATEQLNYFLSGGYFQQNAVVKRWDLNRMTFRANSDYTVNGIFRFGEALSASYDRVVRGQNGGGDGFLLSNAATMPPFFQIYDTDKSIKGNRYGFNGNVNVAGLTIGNENGINQIVDNFDRAGRLLGGVYGQANLVRHVLLKSQANVDFRTSYNESWSPGYTAAELGLPRESQDYNDARGLGTSFVWTNTATVADTLGNHHFNALGGIELQQYQDHGVSAAGHGFLSTDSRYYRIAKNADSTSVGGGGSESAFLGYLGRLSYDFAQKYLLTATVRRDGTSTFSPVGNRRWGTFPSISAAWRVSEEPFFHVPGVNEFKLRGSWGELGNSQTAAYPYLTRVFVDPDYGLGGSTTVKAPSPVNFVNQDLTWETQRISDFGIETGLFGDVVTFSATYYRKDTRNFLVGIPLPAVTGFATVPVNAGSVRNTGMEFELGYTPALSHNMRLTVSGNLTTVKNRLTALSPGIEEYSSDDVYRTAVGYPIGYIYGFKTDGIYQTAAEAAAALPDNTTGKTAQPGDIRFVDTNGPAAAGSPAGQRFSGTPDGKITPDDRTYLGKTIPDYYYGLSATAGWKAIDVSMFFQGVGGVQLYNQFRRGAESMSGGGRNQLATTANRWTGAGTSNSMPRAVANDPNANDRMSDRWVEDGDYLRLKNLQVGFTVPQRYVRGRFSTARVFVAGTNLLTFTKYSGLDPEVQTYGADAYGVSTTTNQLGSGTDAGNIPQPKVFQLGLSLGF